MYSLFAAATWECRFSTLDLVTRPVSQLITLHLLSKNVSPLCGCNMGMQIFKAGPLNSPYLTPYHTAPTFNKCVPAFRMQRENADFRTTVVLDCPESAISPAPRSLRQHLPYLPCRLFHGGGGCVGCAARAPPPASSRRPRTFSSPRPPPMFQ